MFAYTICQKIILRLICFLKCRAFVHLLSSCKSSQQAVSKTGVIYGEINVVCFLSDKGPTPKRYRLYYPYRQYTNLFIFRFVMYGYRYMKLIFQISNFKNLYLKIKESTFHIKKTNALSCSFIHEDYILHIYIYIRKHISIVW